MRLLTPYPRNKDNLLHFHKLQHFSIDLFCKIFKPILFPVPLTFFGEGSYALTAVKAIDGTEQFLNLAEKTEICQNKETFENCLTREYLAQGMDQCNCTLYRLKTIQER